MSPTLLPRFPSYPLPLFVAFPRHEQRVSPPDPLPPPASCCLPLSLSSSPGRNSGCSPPTERPPLARCRSHHGPPRHSPQGERLCSLFPLLSTIAALRQSALSFRVSSSAVFAPTALTKSFLSSRFSLSFFQIPSNSSSLSPHWSTPCRFTQFFAPLPQTNLFLPSHWPIPSHIFLVLFSFPLRCCSPLSPLQLQRVPPCCTLPPPCPLLYLSPPLGSPAPLLPPPPPPRRTQSSTLTFPALPSPLSLPSLVPTASNGWREVTTSS